MSRTADRRRCTGETHQELHQLLPADGTALGIPDAERVEQARLEASVFKGACAMGGLSRYPLGIIRVRPEPGQLTLQLLNAPYVAWYWAQCLLPRHTGEAAADPLDQVGGVPGLRVRRTGTAVTLYRPQMPARIILTGITTRWWDRVLRRMNAEEQDLLHLHPRWTRAEKAAYEAAACVPFEPPARVFSPLLRRIHATAGDGLINSTDFWSSSGAFRLEATDGPSCPELVRLVGDSPAGMGWKVDHKQCTCLCDHGHHYCDIDFTDPSTGTAIHYSNCKWGRTPSARLEQRITELNARALR